MEIRSINEEDYDKVIKLCKKYYSVHNLFSKDKEDIYEYFNKASERNDLLVCEDKSIHAFVVVVPRTITKDGKHRLWKLMHFAYDDENAAEALLLHCEDSAKDESKTAKIELHIADGEKGLTFFKDNGYKIQGTLKDHYRYGEDCFIIGKTIK